MPRQLANREKKFLGFLGADRTINSGATFGDGDGIIRGSWTSYGVEVKCTDAKSFSVKAETWKKIAKEANRLNHEPVLAVDIQGVKLVVLDANEFVKLREYYNHEDN